MKLIEPFFYHDIIISKSSNIIFNITKPKYEKNVLQNTEKHEGSSNGYYKIIQSQNKYLLYYRAIAHDCYKDINKNSYYLTQELQKYECFCLAESIDGLNFVKLNYNIINNNSIRNNVLKHDVFCHNFFPYYLKKDSKFIGISGTYMFNKGLHLFNSNDGIIWTLNKCIITDKNIVSNQVHDNHFDTHNCIVYNKIDNFYYIYIRDNNINARFIQYTKSSDLINFDNCKPITIKNFNKNINIYSPGIFEYPNSNYFISIPTTGTDKFKNTNYLMVSKNGTDWNTITENLFNEDINNNRMNINGIIISPTNDKMYIYTHDNACLENNSVQCYSFLLNRIHIITCLGNGFIETDFFNLIDKQLWLNFESFDNGYINVQLYDDNNKFIITSLNFSGNEFDYLVLWNDIININGNYKIRFNLYNCNLYSFAYNK